MKQSDIRRQILHHDARNLQLKRRLAEHGVDWRRQAQVTCRFRAGEQEAAARLAAELYKKGFVEVGLEPYRKIDNAWSLKARVVQSIDRAASHDFTDDMVHTAAALSCSYDGWDACFTDSGDEGQTGS